ncbi:MAG: ABC transporter ATP-binding protein [Lachnospiraceae bacterium]|nr:ABC transporter ATP-binding protein [Lachnospiraceae bacterium]
MNLVFKYLKKKDILLLAISCLCVIFQVIFELKIPEFTAGIALLVQKENLMFSDVLHNGMIILLLAFGSLAMAVVGGYIITGIGTDLATGIRSDVFAKLMSFSLQEASDFDSSSLVTRCTRNIESVLMFWTFGPLLLVRALFTFVLAAVKMGNTDIRWIYTVGTASLFALILLSVVFLTATGKMMDVQTYMDVINRQVGEHIGGIRVVHAFNAYGFQKKAFDVTDRKLTDFNITVNKAVSILAPGLTVTIYGLTIAVFAMGTHIISQADIAQRPSLYADMIEFSSYATLIMGAVVFLMRGLGMIPDVLISSKRIKEILDHPTVINDGPGATVKADAPAVSFEHVYFGYPGAASNVLEDISFRALKGETVAFIGNTGCGKSTLLNLIPRLYEATSGKIEINGADIRDYALGDLRNRIGYVPQKAMLFSDTVAGNIDFGDDGGFARGLNEIKKAAMTGQAHEFIMQKPEGYDTQVQRGGANFSGGQRQRLTISRAVCRDPEIYIFDDSFSALDFKTDRQLRKALKENAAGATLIIVAQRIATIRYADRIYVMDNGKIVGEGTHDELMENCTVYQEIAHSQFVGTGKVTSPDGEVLKSLKAGTGSPDLKSGAGKEGVK